jgi:hypothetical protein
MAVFNFVISGTTKTFEVKGPAGLTYEQAKAIFDKQVATGALAGFSTGDVLSALTQTTAGLASATANFSQELAGIKNNSLGIESSYTTKSLSSQISGAINVTSSAGITDTVSAIVGARLRTTPISNPLTIGEYAKATPAVAATVGNLSVAEITAAMAAVEKVVGQTAETVSNSGVGKYAFTCQQLERAGYIKLGTAAKFLTQDQNLTTTVMASSAVWTGKDGVKNVEGITSNGALQTQIQQDLMTTGTQELLQLGINISSMTPSVAGAVAVNAAKDVANTVSWATNSALQNSVMAYLNMLGRAAAFGIDLVILSLNDATKRIKPEIPAVDTVNRQTVDAASVRVIGNSKVPSAISNANNLVTSTSAASALLSFVNEYEANLIRLRDKLISFQISGTIAQDYYDAIRQDYSTAKSTFNSRFNTLYQLAQQTISAATVDNSLAIEIVKNAVSKADTTVIQLEEAIAKLIAKILQTLSTRPM